MTSDSKKFESLAETMDAPSEPKTEFLGNKEATTKSSKLLQQLRDFNLSNVAIFCGNLDPDGMASAFAMETIISLLGGKSSSFYRGAFNRPQNKLFKALLHLNTQPEEKFKIEDYTCIISVDAPASLCPVTPDFIIDHHEQAGAPKVASDVRLIGATSSIMWEYCLSAGVNFSDEVGQRLATALLVGIITDTKNGIVDTSSDLDYQALAFCHKHKDSNLYKEIVNYPKPIYYNDMFCSAWSRKTIEGTFLISGVGPIPEARSGILSDLAEKFVEVEGINTAVIFGIVDKRIDISIRSNSKINIDEFVKTAFGGGGGKPGAGRSTIDLPVLFQNIPETLNEELFETCVKIVKHKVLQIASDKK